MAEPKFEYGNRVKVKHGIYKGRSGIVAHTHDMIGSSRIYVVDITGLGKINFTEETLERVEPKDQTFANKVATTNSSDGGPSSYYDFDPGWNTFNDFMEHKAKHQWQGYSLHLKDIMKAGCRFGVKSGTTDAYDARKMIYSSLRLLGMIEGKDAMRKELEKLLADKQFQQES